MDRSSSKPTEAELVALEKRLRELEGELAQQAEEIRSRIDGGQPDDSHRQAGLIRLREAYGSIKQRWEEWRAQVPARAAAPDEF